MSEQDGKRVPKNDLKLNLTLNEEQKVAVADFYANDVNIVTSDFGCGKSSIACYFGLQCLQKKLFDKVLFCRPVLKSRVGVLGYTPGSTEEKLAPFVDHLRYILKRMYKPSLIEEYEANFEKDKKKAIGYIQIETAEGWNLDETLLIIDESQDLAYDELRNILTRIGKTSKVILLGSFEQIDSSMKYTSCIHTLHKAKESLPEGVSWNELTINNRNQKMYELIKKLDRLK